MTKREFLTAIVARESITDEMVEKAQAELVALDKKNANRKPTKTQVENESLKEVVVSVLDENGATVSEIMTRNEKLATLSNQKVSALLRALVAEGKANKFTEGKKTLFKIA